VSEPSITAEDREEIKAVLARYLQVVDNADWDLAAEVFTPEATFGTDTDDPRPTLTEMIEGFDAMVAARPIPLYPHQCTDPVLLAVAPGLVRSWSKFFTVRDGTVTSGDYLDTFVRTEAGAWRIADRCASMANRPAADLFGPRRRTITSAHWRRPPDRT
jgi:SnoaL-like domain